MNNKEQNMIIAENIKKYLRLKGITQKELADSIGIKPSTMSDYLNLRSKPSHGVIQKIADYFGIGKSDIDTTYKEDSDLTIFNDENKTISKLFENDNDDFVRIVRNLASLSDEQLKIVNNLVTSLLELDNKRDHN
ncbi:helix-turn-helix domain-containing protein [Enterococcus sp. 5H]|uniref:helix-turn-helix domain-containing protein n=1 Tax=Enterococcus sp. 5H TaxID=1229490 RepID=UPI003FA61214|nr:Phage repressor [Enterococcus sp. 5H]